eukprot:GHVL01041943.1.p1 GENE.GHVL01041943.1~~GHVL01041943.1.p1  ORF type:complete len:145 (+),score=17.55 GHVL01041943.1:213-647(+)
MSKLYKEVQILQRRDQLHEQLLRRFGWTPGHLATLECRILKRPDFHKISYIWAENLVKNNKQVDVNNIPRELWKNDEFRHTVESVPELKWIIKKIGESSSNDCIPQPHYPAHLNKTYPQYPFPLWDYYRLQDFMGLLKFDKFSK